MQIHHVFVLRTSSGSNYVCAVLVNTGQAENMAVHDGISRTYDLRSSIPNLLLYSQSIITVYYQFFAIFLVYVLSPRSGSSCSHFNVSNMSLSV